MWTFAPLFLLLLNGPQVASAPDDGQAGRVYETLRRLQDEVGLGRRYSIPEADLNAFLKLEVDRQAPPAIEELAVTLNRDKFTTRLKVDMDELDLRSQGIAATMLASLMSGVQEVVLTGAVETKAGRGTYSTESASLNGMKLPATLVDMLLSAIGSRQSPPFDPTEPFQLPHGIQTITVRNGVVELSN